MLITTRKFGATTILDLRGALMIGDSELVFRQNIKELLDAGVRTVAVNLSGVPDMDSWGLGSLVRHCTKIRKAGGRCVFFGAVPRVLHLLKIAKLDSVLDLAQTESDALSR